MHKFKINVVIDTEQLAEQQAQYVKIARQLKAVQQVLEQHERYRVALQTIRDSEKGVVLPPEAAILADWARVALED